MMDTWIALSPLLPIISVICCIILFHKNAVYSSLIGFTFTVILVILFDAYSINNYQLIKIVNSSFILTLSAVMVIIPGLYLNGVIRKQKTIDKITEWIEEIPISSENKALVLLLGFLPAVESLTGFGVSLFLGVPIFLKLFPTRKALKLSVLGMNIMPWGTLALATIIGSTLIDKSLRQLGTLTSLTSFMVFPYIALVSLFVMGGIKALKKYTPVALILGAIFSSLLLINNYYIATETAGVLAGLLTGLWGIYLASRKKNYFCTLLKDNPLRLFLPYILVLSLIIFINFIHPLKEFLGNLLVISSETVRFSVFTSPGIIILLVALLMQIIKPVDVSWTEVLKKSKNACLSIMTFLFLSQTMLHSGMIDRMAAALSTLAEEKYFLILSPLIGMISGFTTGSNVGGNALLITVQDEIGQQWNQGALFAAVHNSGAGHMVFSSIPILILVLAIVKDIQQSEKINVTESYLMNFTLKVSIGIYFCIFVSTFLVLKYANVFVFN